MTITIFFPRRRRLVFPTTFPTISKYYFRTTRSPEIEHQTNSIAAECKAGARGARISDKNVSPRCENSSSWILDAERIERRHLPWSQYSRFCPYRKFWTHGRRIPPRCRMGRTSCTCLRIWQVSAVRSDSLAKEQKIKQLLAHKAFCIWCRVILQFYDYPPKFSVCWVHHGFPVIGIK